MEKKKPTSRKTARKSLASTNSRSPRKNHRAATVTTSELLPVVDGESGRSLQLRAQLGLNRESFARLVPMSTRNLANIESGKPPSDTVLRRLKELRRVVDALAEIVQKDAIGPWLNRPNDAFDGLKPIEVIERGEVDRIWQMIFFLRSGTPS